MQSGIVQASFIGSEFFLRLVGDVRLPWCVTLENFCDQTIGNNQFTSMTVDLTSADNLDSTTLGIIAKVGMLAQKSLGKRVALHCINESIYRLICSMGFESIFAISREANPLNPDYKEVALVKSDEQEVRESVIRAHKTLMGVDKDNFNNFKDLVENLEEKPKI